MIIYLEKEKIFNMNDLKKKSIRSIKWSTINVVLSTIFTFATFIIIGVYFDAETYGVKSIVTVVIGLSTTFAQFGISKAIIKEKTVTKRELDSLFWVNIMFGVVTMIILYFIAIPISNFFGEPELISLLRLSSLVFLLEPIDLIFRSYLQKELKIDVLEKGFILRAIFTNGSLIIFVILGWGVYSFVYSTIIGVLVLTVYCYIYFYSRKMWLPSFYLKLPLVKKYYKFGLYVFLKNILSYSVRNVDSIIVGKALGNETLGVYNFAKDILKKISDIVSNILQKVSYPIFSSIKNEDNTLFSKYYLFFTKIISLLIVPITVFTFAFSKHILEFLFDDKWSAAVVLVQIFAVKLLFDVLSRGFATSGLYAFDKPKSVLKLEIWFTPIRIILLLLASLVSVEMVALSFLITVIAKSFVAQFLLNNVAKMTMLEYLKQLVTPLITSFIAIAFALLFNKVSIFNGIMLFDRDLNIVFIGLIFVILYIGSMIFKEKKDFKILIDIVKKNK